MNHSAYSLALFVSKYLNSYGWCKDMKERHAKESVFDYVTLKSIDNMQCHKSSDFPADVAFTNCNQPCFI